MDKDKTILSRMDRFTHRLGKRFRLLRENGFAFCWSMYKACGRNRYDRWIRRTDGCSAMEAAKQRHCKFERKIWFSIIVPVYNTPERFLKEMIRSVRAQTYADWQLCIADASDSRHDSVGAICRRYAEKDSRISYRKLEQNFGISGNSNACLEMAGGDYIALLDHDDILSRIALHEVMKVLCMQDADLVYTDEALFQSPDIHRIFHVHYKPDYAPDTLRSQNYFCHLTVFRRSLLEKIGGFRSEYDGSQDHDLVLRITALTKNIVHIPKVLYFWRAHHLSSANDVENKPYAYEAGRRAVEDSVHAAGLHGRTVRSPYPGYYRTIYEIEGVPLVSIIILHRDNADLLEQCLRSIEEKSSYLHREIIIVESIGRKSGAYENLRYRWPDVRFVPCPENGISNDSAAINYAVRTAAKGEILLLLDQDTEVISENWMEEMLMFAQRRDVGAVGAKLYYWNNTIQHAGVILGMDGTAGHCFLNTPRDGFGYCGRLHHVQNLSAVSGACLMIRREVWEEAGGLDEGFPTVYYDINLCLSVRKAGYLIVWTPFAELYHDASNGCITGQVPEEERERQAEKLHSRWQDVFDAGDPYFNPNLSLYTPDCSLAWEFYELEWRRKRGSKR